MIYQTETLLNLQEPQTNNRWCYLNYHQYDILQYFDWYIAGSLISMYLKNTVQS